MGADLLGAHVALVFSIVGEATALTWKSTNEVGVLDTSSLKLLPEVGPPTALGYHVSVMCIVTQ
jgi:hypothetical protein